MFKKSPFVKYSSCEKRAITVFEEVVINQFSISHSKPNKEVTSYFSYEELNALRYTAGYVIKVVMEKVQKSKKDEHLKEELILCLSSFKEREEREGKLLVVAIFVESPAIILLQKAIGSHINQQIGLTALTGVDYSMLMILCFICLLLWSWSFEDIQTQVMISQLRRKQWMVY